MMARDTVLILALACLAAVGGYALQRHLAAPRQPPPPPGVKTLAVGDRVAGITLPGLDGPPRSLSAWRGKRILLNFWATWCVPCRREMPLLSTTQSRYAREGVQVIGVAMDPPQSALAYLRRVKVDYPILVGIDADPEPTLLFGDTAGLLPYSVLIGRDGRILDTQLGPLSEARIRSWLGSAPQ
jgi:thiol-disulfide isomerase/thioredoxin